MIAKVLRWGNSFGIRISKADALTAGLREGHEVVVDIRAKPGDRFDPSVLSTLSLGGLASRHDEVDWA